MSAATTHYIAANGADLNNGTSKTTPWLHMPGMPACSSTCASYNPLSGDQIILRGGDSWTNTNFPILWTWSGSSGSPIYVGVDKTWYSGASWAQPIFNAGGTPIAGTKDDYIWSPSVSYVTWDNLELMGLNWQTSYPYGSLACAYFAKTNHIIVSNWYIHGWSHTNGVTSDGFQCLIGTSGGVAQPGNIVTNSIFNGSDTTNGGDSGEFAYAWAQATYNTIHNVPNALLLSGDGEVGNNLIYNNVIDFDGVTHANAIEVIGVDGSPWYFHDNVVHDIFGEPLFIGGVPGQPSSPTFYVWNNLFWNLQNDGVGVDARTGGRFTVLFLNNTVVSVPGAPCFEYSNGGSVYAYSATLANNHCITTGALDNFSADRYATVTRTSNLTQTPTVATGQGYTAAQQYVYSPLPGGSTIRTGTNLTLNWPVGYSITETSYAGARTPVARPATGAWDIGAYEPPRPSPPNGLNGAAK